MLLKNKLKTKSQGIAAYYGLFLSLLILSLKAYTQHSYVFVGSYNTDKNKDGIYIFKLDTLTGTLKKISTLKGVLNPSFIILSQNGQYLYACTDTRTPKDGSVSSFRLDTAALTLKPVSSQKTNGENPVYINLYKNEKWLLSANYNDGSVSVFPVDETGNIGALKQFIHYTDSSIHPIRQKGSHIHATVFSPDYKFVFLPDLGADKIRAYAIDTMKTEVLQNTSPSFIKMQAGSGPRHLTFHPTKKNAYCIEELSGYIRAFSYRNGKLNNLQRISLHKRKKQMDYSSADIHITPNGKFLYASNRGDENNIAIFSVKNKGKLKFIGLESSFGKTPRNFCIDESGKFLIVANQSSGNVIVFKINAKTGLLQKTYEELDIPGASCVQIKSYK